MAVDVVHHPFADNVALALCAAFLVVLLVPTATASPPTAEPDPWFTSHDVALERFEADVDIRDGLASTKLAFTFQNQAEDVSEAIIAVPLPPLSTLTGFVLHLDNETWYGRVLEHAKAQAEYNESLEAGDDAVLLESTTSRFVKLRINVAASATRTLELTWLTYLGLQDGTRSYRLDTSRLEALGPVAETAVTVDLRGSAGIADVLLTADQLDTTLTQRGHVRLQTATSDRLFTDDLVVHWTEGEGAWLAGLSIGPGPEQGPFYGLATIGVRDFETTGALPRDIVFVLDTSGSMAREKIEQARESLREVLTSLRPDDRFGIVTFAQEATLLTHALLPVTSESVASMRETLLTVEASGGTNFDAGLQQALGLLGNASDGRAPMVVVLSDGLPTEGVVAPDLIVSRMTLANLRAAPVHVVAIGFDANDAFLQSVAAESGGSVTAFDPDDDLQQRLADFYAGLAEPVLTQVTLTIEGIDTYDPLPARIPDLYADSTFRVLFRIDEVAERGVLVLRGLSADGAVEERFTVSVGERMPDLWRLYGQAQVQGLLERLDDDNTTADAVVDAALRYGVVTPFTSWVIVRMPAEQAEAEKTDETSFVEVPVVPQYLTRQSAGSEGGAVPSTTASASYDYSPLDGALQNWAAPHLHDVDLSPAGSPSDDGADAEATPAPTVAVLVVLAIAVLLVFARRP